VTATLKPGDTGAETVVSIHTSLNVTGRPAQFGRSLLPEVSGKLIQQFATNLEAMITADTAADETVSDDTAAGETTAAATGAPATGVASAPETAGETAQATAEAPAESSATASVPVAAKPTAPVARPPAAPAVKQEESLNAFKFIVVPILKRLIPVAAVGAAGAAIAVIFRRSRSKKS
jgi:hypothetical protein